MKEFLSGTTNGIPNMVFLWGGVILVFAVLSVIYSIGKNKKNKTALTGFLAQHPDAAKIYTMNKGVVTSDTLEIHLVDGAAPLLFNESGRAGVYVSPGEHTLQISSTYTRPGVMYRSVSKSTGVVDKIIEAEPYGEYDLAFDRKEGAFSFTLRGQA